MMRLLDGTVKALSMQSTAIPTNRPSKMALRGITGPLHDFPAGEITMAPKLYSYVVKRDYGFAPNPFYGFCTLATCKPEIRKRAKVDDWIIGTGSKSKNKHGHIVFAMRVTEAMSFEEYWQDLRFHSKRPVLRSSLKRAYGDNIYSRDSNTNRWRQSDSHHALFDGTENPKNINHDTKANRVLASDDFVYWGGSGPELPEFQGYDLCKKGPSHKCKFPEEVVGEFTWWIRGLEDRGYCGHPLDWG